MLPALALGLAGFLANFDVTSVIVALPAIARELGLGIAGYSWVMDAYSLAFTGTLLIAGALADRHGRRRALIGGNIAFALASVACGIAWDGLSLIAARALQGAASAFVVTGAFSLVANSYPDAAARARAFSLLGVITGAGMALGPTTGGLIASGAGWRWIFFANIPACFFIAWLVPRLVPECRDPAPRPLDYPGMAFFTAGLVVFVAILLHGQDSRALLAAGLVLTMLLFGAFVVQQRRRTTPIFDPAVFLSRPLMGIAALLAAVSIGYWAILVFLPPLFSAAFGWTASQSGLAMLAATLPMLFVPLAGGALVQRLGWRRYFALALAFIAVGNAIMFGGLVAGTTPSALMLLCGMGATGIGAALAHPQLSGSVVALAPAAHAGMASAMTVVMRQGAFAVGIAVLGASLATPDVAAAYSMPFMLAFFAAFGGACAALFCLPARSRNG
jgi:MFS family permease